jgi:2-oxoisovalerate dehydrogenase E1 component
VAHVRAGHPFVQVVDTRRLGPHSKGDDTRPAHVLDALRASDPLGRRLAADPRLAAAFAEVQRQVAALAVEVAARAEVTPEAPSSAVPTRSSAVLHGEPARRRGGRLEEPLARGWRRALATDPALLMLGQDLGDPYGGAFKVTRGLSTEHPGRVLSTPIAEAGTALVATGLALGGLHPVVEVMFSDFATLVADALINHAAKIPWVTGVTCPLLVRLVSGGGRGYGATHSQSLELLFCGVPGLRVLALSARHDVRALLEAALASGAPTVLVEPKAIYPLPSPAAPPLDLRPAPSVARDCGLPPLCYVPADGGGADVTLLTYGGGTLLAEPAMEALIVERELRFEYIVLTQLSPLDVGAVAASVARTGRLLVIEENTVEYGVAAAVIAAVTRQIGGFSARATGAVAVPIPAARALEERVLPSVERVTADLRELAAMPARKGANVP